jgi:hypothetical protein
MGNLTWASLSADCQRGWLPAWRGSYFATVTVSRRRGTTTKLPVSDILAVCIAREAVDQLPAGLARRACLTIIETATELRYLRESLRVDIEGLAHALDTGRAAEYRAAAAFFESGRWPAYRRLMARHAAAVRVFRRELTLNEYRIRQRKLVTALAREAA